MERKAFLMVVLLSLLMAFNANKLSVSAKNDTLTNMFSLSGDVVDLEVSQVRFTDGSPYKIFYGDVIGEHLDLVAFIKNVGTVNVTYLPGEKQHFSWWYVHESYVDEWIESTVGPNHPYWDYICTGEFVFPDGFNWTVGYIQNTSIQWYTYKFLNPYLYGWYYLVFDLHFIDDNPHNNSPRNSSLWEGLYTTANHPAPSPPPSFGGIAVPVDKFGLLAPYIALASTILVATAATAIYVKHVKHRKEKQ